MFSLNFYLLAAIFKNCLHKMSASKEVFCQRVLVCIFKNSVHCSSQYLIILYLNSSSLYSWNHVALPVL